MNLRQLLHKLLHITATTLFLHDKNTPVRDAVMVFGAKRFDFIRSWLSTITSQTTRLNISTTYQTTHFCVVPEIQGANSHGDITGQTTTFASKFNHLSRLRRNDGNLWDSVHCAAHIMGHDQLDHGLWRDNSHHRRSTHTGRMRPRTVEELMSNYTMKAWAVIYVAADEEGNEQKHEDGSPVLYIHPHEDLDYVSGEDLPHEDFETVDELRYTREAKTQ